MLTGLIDVAKEQSVEYTHLLSVNSPAISYKCWPCHVAWYSIRNKTNIWAHLRLKQGFYSLIILSEKAK